MAIQRSPVHLYMASLASQIAAQRLQRHHLNELANRGLSGVRTPHSSPSAEDDSSVIHPFASSLLKAPYRVLDPQRADGAHFLGSALRMSSYDFYRMQEYDERAIH